MTNAQINHQTETMISNEALSKFAVALHANAKCKTHAAAVISLQLIVLSCQKYALPRVGATAGAHRVNVSDTRSPGRVGLVLPAPFPRVVARIDAPRIRKRGTKMEGLLIWIGRIAGAAGLVLSAIAAYARLKGAYFMGGFQIGTLLMVGMTGLLVACFCLLLVLTQRTRR